MFASAQFNRLFFLDMNMSISNGQKKIAKQLGIRIDSYDSFRIAAAKILDRIAVVIGEKEAVKPTERQIEYAKTLVVYIKNDSRRVISAKIEDELEKRNIKALKKLKLKPGDKVLLKEKTFPREYVISSIKENGKIYFKGIGCPQAWVSQIETKIENKS